MIPARAISFTLFQIITTGSGAHITFCSVNMGIISPKRGGPIERGPEDKGAKAFS
jgi:hypothetical protein